MVIWRARAGLRYGYRVRMAREAKPAQGNRGLIHGEVAP